MNKRSDNAFLTMIFTHCNKYIQRNVHLCNLSLLLALIIFWEKFSGSMRKIFPREWLQWDSNLRCWLSKNQVSNAVKETKPKVRRVFMLPHRAALGFIVNLLNFVEHLFRDGEVNFERNFRSNLMSTRVCTSLNEQQKKA